MKKPRYKTQLAIHAVLKLKYVIVHRFYIGKAVYDITRARSDNAYDYERRVRKHANHNVRLLREESR